MGFFEKIFFRVDLQLFDGLELICIVKVYVVYCCEI